MYRMWKRINNPWEPRDAPMIGKCNAWTEAPNINSTRGLFTFLFDLFFISPVLPINILCSDEYFVTIITRI